MTNACAINQVAASMSPSFSGLHCTSSPRFMQWLKERNASDNVCELFMSFRLSGQIDAGDGLIFTDIIIKGTGVFLSTLDSTASEGDDN